MQSSPTLRLERVIAGGVERTYSLFTAPEHVSDWFTTTARSDLRVGGRYSNTDGDTGEFLAVEPPHRVVFTWENPGHCPGTRVAVTFEARGDAETLLVLEHSGFASPEDRDAMSEGWSWALDSFRAYAATGRPIPHEEWLEERSGR
jgi:uncharacterized protein YndB with AHSA1/START domain